MKYDELIKDLRICASTFCESCEKCSHSNEHGDCYNGLKRSAADAIKGLLAVIQRQKEMINATAYLPHQKSKWIPVTERLPELDKEVLVYAVGKIDGFIGSSVYALTERFLFKFFPSSKGTEEWRSPWQYFMEDYEITHWMPLPEPPKDGE